jgi:septum formation topological specificity factor MinE
MTSAEGEMHIRQYNHSRTTPSVRKDILQIYNKYIISAENLIKEVNNVSENTHLEEFDRFTVDVKCADHLTKIALALDTYIINHGINKWRMLEEVRINYNKILDVLEPYLNTKTHPEYQTSERLSYK